jgi:hypothetical protein
VANQLNVYVVNYEITYKRSCPNGEAPNVETEMATLAVDVAMATLAVDVAMTWIAVLALVRLAGPPTLKLNDLLAVDLCGITELLQTGAPETAKPSIQRQRQVLNLTFAPSRSSSVVPVMS